MTQHTPLDISIIRATSIVLLLMTVISVITHDARTLKTDILDFIAPPAHAETDPLMELLITAQMDPCAPVPHQNVDPSPANPAACTAWWTHHMQHVNGEKQVSFTSQPGFPCHPSPQYPTCSNVYKYHTSVKQAKSILNQVRIYKHNGGK